MTWLERGNRWLCNPYHIHRNVRGFEVWFSTKSKYGILARELASLAAAKDFAEKHSREVA